MNRAAAPETFYPAAQPQRGAATVVRISFRSVARSEFIVHRPGELITDLATSYRMRLVNTALEPLQTHLHI